MSFTSVGFPYSDDKTDPRLQRFRVIQSKRSFYDHSGTQTFTEIGFMLSAFDRNAVRTLESSFGAENLIDWTDDAQCDAHIYCGFPMYRFDMGRYTGDFSEDPLIVPTKFNVLRTTREPNNASQLRVEISLELYTLTVIYITPGNGWKFVDSSLKTTERKWREKSFQLSKITFGKQTNEVTEEFILLEVRNLK